MTGRLPATSERTPILILLLVGAAVLLVGLGFRALWDVDEGRHTATAKEMVMTGDWVVPRLNGENFFDKPPLYNWLTATSLVVLGFTEFAARLPSALLGLGAALVTYGLGRRMFGVRAGLLGGVVLLTSIEYVILSRAVVHDISLAFFMTCTLALFYAGFEDERRRAWLFRLAWATTALAFLAKGPVGLVVPAMVAGAFLLSQRRLRLVREMQLLWGPLIFLVIAAPWYVAISLRESDYFQHFFIKQNLGYFFSGESEHPEPFWYYVPVLFGGLFPWSCFLPMAVIHALRTHGRKMAASTMFLLLWLVVPMVFFSIAQSKLATYILVVFPAAALLIGCVWRDLIEAPLPDLRRGFLISAAPLAGLALLATVFVAFVAPPDLWSHAGLSMDVIRPLVFIVAALGGLAFVLLVVRRPRASFATIVAAVTVFMWLFVYRLSPSIEPYRSSRQLALRMDEILTAGAPMTNYMRMRDSSLFYTDRPIQRLRTVGQLRDHLEQEEPAIAIVSLRHLDQPERDPLRNWSYVIEVVGNKAIVSNVPDP